MLRKSLLLASAAAVASAAKKRISGRGKPPGIALILGHFLKSYNWVISQRPDQPLRMAVISEEIDNHEPTRSRLVLRSAFCLLAAFIALSIAAPFVNAARFSASIQIALQESLGRPVSFEKVYYRVLPVPGFSLERVTIGEDPRFGLEPFAFMNGLEARLRIDKLLTGQIRFASLRLIDPSLNIVKRADGAWNVVEFVGRMSAPRALPLNLIPAIQVSNGRFDFKLGARKTIFYITEADVSIYPERSGRVILNFSGSPARTDRAGNGFGSMRGSLNWLVNPPSAQTDQLEADVTLDPSNLSELTTLIQGQDIGVHGTISSRAHIAGPLAALKVAGDLRLRDVHRWDLLPSTGDDWRVSYAGNVDLLAHRLDLRTLPPSPGETVPATVQVKVNDFLSQPAWTLMTSLNQAPVASLLPLARRMGFGLPPGVELSGSVNGVVGYSNTAGLLGEVSIHEAVAKLPQIAPIDAVEADIKIMPNSLHLEPATLKQDGGGTLQVGGDYEWDTQRLAAAITVQDVGIETLKNTAQAWFGEPAALSALGGGSVTGKLQYASHRAETALDPAFSPGWSGEFQFTGATILPTGVAIPLTHAQGNVVFTPITLDVAHFTAMFAANALAGSYHYNHAAKHAERLHLELAAAGFDRLVTALEPAWREPGLLARLPFTKRSIPAWMTARDLEGDLVIGRFAVSDNALGALTTRFFWQGVNLQFINFQLFSPAASLKGVGNINLAGRAPTLKFKGKLTGYRWGGGIVDAEGVAESSGVGLDALRSFHAAGSFSAADVSLSLNDDFAKLSGAFEFSFASGWPQIRLAKIQAVQPAQDWSGEALSNSDGQLVFDLGNGDRQLRIVSLLVPPPPTSPAAVARK